MKRNRLAIALAAALVAATALFFGGVAQSPGEDAPSPRRADAFAAQLVNGFAAGNTANEVRELERQTAKGERPNAQTFAILGLAYLQRVRETGDPGFYPRAERAFEAALRLDAGDPYATTGLAALAASRHHFDEARRLAERAAAVSPSAAPYGILGDALVELGRYEEAFAAFDRMVSLKPSATAYARVSYARQLLGDTKGAEEAMKLAVEAAGPAAEPAAWATVHLGNLQLERGRLERAARLYRHALGRLPGYAPALGALAQVEFLRGRHRAAVELYRDALAQSPLPEFAVGLGDTYAALGDVDAAEAAWKRSEKLERSFARYGGRNDLETALFDLDHDRNLRSALERARTGQRERPSVEGEHVLAWALYKNGRCEEARRHSTSALRLGTKDLDALYHRSLIERCLGNHAAAKSFLQRVRTLNPYYLRSAPSAARLGQDA